MRWRDEEKQRRETEKRNKEEKQRRETEKRNKEEKQRRETEKRNRRETEKRNKARCSWWYERKQQKRIASLDLLFQLTIYRYTSPHILTPWNSSTFYLQHWVMKFNKHYKVKSKPKPEILASQLWQQFQNMTFLGEQKISPKYLPRKKERKKERKKPTHTRKRHPNSPDISNNVLTPLSTIYLCQTYG